MLDLLFLSVFLVFFIFGFKRPYIACLGYTWIDTVRPQTISYGFLRTQPLSMYITVCLAVSLLIHCYNLKLLRSKSIVMLMFIFFAWITYSTFFIAILPEEAFVRWNFNYKVILLCIIIPLTIDNCKQLESLLLIWILSISYFTLSTGIKTFFGAGGYGAHFIIGSFNAGLSESSSLASLAVAIIPLLFFLRKRSLLLKDTPLLLTIACFGLIFSSILTVIGTYARTGLVGLATYAMLSFFKTKNKILTGSILVVSAIAILIFIPEDYKNRMNTMKSVQTESSALSRLLVWRWTLDFVKEYPFGGGFSSYKVNGGQLTKYLPDETPSSVRISTQYKAYHSIYFQLLGDLGWVGLFIYLSVLLTVFLKFRKIARIAKYNEFKNNKWVHNLAVASNTTLIILHVCGSFIGVAFQPFFLYFMITVVLSLEKICLNNVYEASAQSKKEESIDWTERREVYQ